MKNICLKPLGPAALLTVMLGTAAYAFAVYGAIGEKYAKLNKDRGPLGAPTSDEAAAPNGGRFNEFQNGFIYYHAQAGGAFAVLGEIGKKWNSLGRVAYGYPINDETATTDGRGRFNHFRAVQAPQSPEASIFWSPNTGAHAVYGKIREKWASIGWERSPLGYPTSDEFQSGSSRRVDFERGSILYSANDGTKVISASDAPTPAPGTFGNLLVKGIEVVADAPTGTGTIPIVGDTNFLSANNLCVTINNPPGPVPTFDQFLKRMVPVINSKELSGSPFKLRSDISGTLSGDCRARASVVSTAGGDITLDIGLPGNRVVLYLTTPDIHVGPFSIGAPGSVDPKASVTFDLTARTTIPVPTKVCDPIGLGPTNVTATNIKLHGENITGDVGLFTAKVIKFFSGKDFLKGLTDDRFIRHDGVTRSLKTINPRLCDGLPRNARVQTEYNSARSTLVLRATTRAPDPGPVVR